MLGDGKLGSGSVSPSLWDFDRGIGVMGWEA